MHKGDFIEDRLGQTQRNVFSALAEKIKERRKDNDNGSDNDKDEDKDKGKDKDKIKVKDKVKVKSKSKSKSFNGNKSLVLADEELLMKIIYFFGCYLIDDEQSAVMHLNGRRRPDYRS